MGNVESIRHVPGYKDQFKVSVQIDEDTSKWEPSNDQVFHLIDLLFDSEDHSFNDGYGRWMLWWNISLIVLGYEQKAHDAYGLKGQEALDHFEQTVEDHGDELIREVLRLKRGEKDGCSPRDERLPVHVPNKGDG